MANKNAGTVTPIDLATHKAGPPIQVGSTPVDIGFTPNGRTAYVANAGSTWVTPINTVSGRASSPVQVGADSLAIAIAPDGKTAYVLTSDGTVVPFATSTGVRARPIAVGANPVDIAIAPNGKTAYVLDSNGTVVPIDLVTGRAEATVQAGSGLGTGWQPALPTDIALTPDGKTAYVLSGADNTVTPIHTATDRAGRAIPVGARPFFVAVAPDGKTVWVVNNSGNSVTPIDTATNLPGPEIPVGPGPLALAVTPDSKKVYVVNGGGDTVTPINATTDRAGPPITVGQNPVDIVANPDGRAVYALNNWWGGSNNGTVTPISTATDKAGTPITVGENPYWIAIAQTERAHIPPPGTAGPVPTLGSPKACIGSPGCGQVRPSEVGFIPELEHVTSVVWRTWGGPHAVGTGDASYIPPKATTGRFAKATVVAFDLGSCGGRYAYRSLEWYFPEYGMKFSPSTVNLTPSVLCPEEPTTTATSSTTTSTKSVPAVKVSTCIDQWTVSLAGSVDWQGQSPGEISTAWGDGSPVSNGPFPTGHTYPEIATAKPYTITVTASSRGLRGTASAHVTVGERQHTCNYSVTSLTRSDGTYLIAPPGSLSPGQTVTWSVDVTSHIGASTDGQPLWATVAGESVGRFAASRRNGTSSSPRRLGKGQTLLRSANGASDSSERFLSYAALKGASSGPQSSDVLLSYTAPNPLPSSGLDILSITDSTRTGNLAPGADFIFQYDFKPLPVTQPPDELTVAPEPCGSNEIALYISGIPNRPTCETVAQYMALPPASRDPCPYFGTQDASGFWDCNSAPSGGSPVITSQYGECLDEGLGFLNQCDPKGFAAQTVAGILPGADEVQKAVAGVQLVLNHSPSASTLCGGYTVAMPTSSTSAVEWLMDEACTFFGKG